MHVLPSAIFMWKFLRLWLRKYQHDNYEEIEFLNFYILLFDIINSRCCI